MAVDLLTVVAELQFLNQLATQTSNAPLSQTLKNRINALAKQSVADLREAVVSIGGDDPIIGS